jgi:hypothetical protein
MVKYKLKSDSSIYILPNTKIDWGVKLVLLFNLYFTIYQLTVYDLCVTCVAAGVTFMYDLVQ